MDVPFLDVLVAGLLVFAFGYGLRAGMIRELLGLLGIAAGIYLALHLHYQVMVRLSEVAWLDGLRGIVAYLLVFLVTLAMFRWFAWLLTRLFNVGSIGAINRMGGGILSLLQMALVCGVIGWGLRQYDVLTEEDLQQSELTRRIVLFGEAVIEWFEFMEYDRKLQQVWQQAADSVQIQMSR